MDNSDHLSGEDNMAEIDNEIINEGDNEDEDDGADNEEDAEIEPDDEENDEDDDEEDEGGDTELNDKLYDACEQKNFEEVKRLVELGANVNSRKSEDTDGKTPLMVAAVDGTYEIVQYLLEKGADPQMITWASSTDALNFACRSPNVDVIKLLMAPREEGGGGLAIDRPAGGNWTVVHSAANWGQTEVLKYLLSIGAPADALTTTGRTPLSLAAECGRIGCMKVLLEAGAKPNIPDPVGQTAIFYAARVVSIDCLKLLVEVGKADVNYVDRWGNTSFSEADRMSMWEQALYLWKQGASIKGLKRANGKFSSLTWSRPISLNAPSARYSSNAFSVGNRVWMLGGFGLPTDTVNPDPEATHHAEGGNLRDIYYCDLDKMENIFLGKKIGNKQDMIDEMQLNALNPERCAKNLLLQQDGLTVSSSAGLDPDLLGTDDGDCACVQAIKPFTPEDPLTYFEITVIDHGKRNIITFGLTFEEFDLDALPGWKKKTIGYHGDDGQLFYNRGRGTPWGTRYGTGDTVGCGVNYKTREVFFTKNGEFLGVAVKGVSVDKWFPTVGFRSPSAIVRVNFGLEPFKFSFSAPMLKWIKADIQYIDSHVPQQPFTVVDYTPTSKIFLSTELTEMTRVHIFDFEKLVMSSKPVSCPEGPYMYGLVCSVRVGDNVYFACRRRNKLKTFDTTVWRMDISAQHFESWPVTRIIPPLPKQAPIADDKDPSAMHVETVPDPFDWAAHLIAEFGKPDVEIATTDNKILFIGRQDMLEFNPVTGDARKLEASGRFPNTKSYSKVNVDNQIVTFGGWNEQEQQFDVHIFEQDRSIWYKPHVTGTVPRPRNNNATVYTENLGKMMFIGGWNGRNFIDDVDILSIQTLVPEEFGMYLNSSELFDVMLQVQNQSVKCHKAILYCRSKYFKSMLEKDPNVTQLTITDVKSPLFYALLNYLYTDLIDTTQVTEDLVHEFIELCEIYAHEHVPRITEELLLTRVQQSSTMSDDLNQIINQKLFSDVEFVIEGQTYYAHKVIICARSEYFRGMCLGNLRESKQRVIELSDVTSATWPAIIQWLYCKRPDWNAITAHASEIYAASGHYAALGLKTAVETALLAQLEEELANEELTAEDLSAALAVYELADSCNAIEFARSCAKILSNAQSVIAAQQIVYVLSDDERMLYTKAISSVN
jgi:ankyrin repeat protein